MKETEQKKVLILCASDPNEDQRPNRMIHWLKSNYDLTVVGGAPLQLEGIKSFVLNKSTSNNNSSFWNSFKKNAKKYSFRAIRYLFFLLFRRHEDILWSQFNYSKTIRDELSKENFDIIISHDLILMPLAFAIKGNKQTKIMLDAREFYPRVDSSLRWRILTKPIYDHLCHKYLHRCDKIITVSEGLAREYSKEYGIQADIIMSLPFYHNLEPNSLSGNKIKIIYHGHASSFRKTELMIEMMDFVDERFSLDLMLANPSSDKYLHKINLLTKNRDNVQVVSPVSMKEIIPFTNLYDIGLYLAPSVNFNMKYMLPNKLFEYIQARLVVAIGPSVEMQKIVKKYDCGIISKDFEPRSLAEKLNQLTSEKLLYYKEESHKTAQKLNADTNKILINEILFSLLI